MSSVRTGGSWFVISLALLGLVALLWVAVAEAFGGSMDSAWQALKDGKHAARPQELLLPELTLSIDQGHIVADGRLPAGAEASRLLANLTEQRHERSLIYRVTTGDDVVSPRWLAGVNSAVASLPLSGDDSLMLALGNESIELSGTLGSASARQRWQRAANAWTDNPGTVVSHIQVIPRDSWTLTGTRQDAALVLTGAKSPVEPSLSQDGGVVRDERATGRVGLAPLTEAELTQALSLFSAEAPVGSVINLDASGNVVVSLSNASPQTMTELESSLRRALKGKRIRVDAKAGEPAPTLRPGESEQLAVNFGYNSAQISPDSFASLDVLVRRLQARPDVRLLIEGHTDTSGNPEANLYLSRLRAEAVRDYLVGAGIDDTRLRVVGYGDTRPVADNSTAGGRHRNRRIEIREFSS